MLEKEKELSIVVKRIALKLLPNNPDNIQSFIYKMFCNVILFHDFGKINPAFQIQKMKNNKVPIKTLDGLSGSDHSLFSAVIYLDYFLEEIEKSSYPKKDKSLLTVLLWINAYVISRHHSDLEQMIDFTSKFKGKDGEIGYLLDVLTQSGLEGYAGLRSLSSDTIEKCVKKVFKCKR